MSRFNTKVSNKTVNLAGGKAFSMNSESELVRAVLTTFLDDKYYEKGADRVDRLKNLIANVKPEFTARLAYVARTEFHLRSVSHLLLGELIKNNKGREDGLIWKTIEKTIQRPDDILELVSYLEGHLSKQVRKGIRRSLYKFNRYQLAKYRGEGHSYRMVDIFNLVHPKPQFATEEQKIAWKDLIEGNLKSFDTWENDVKKLPELVLENKIGYMALLRNLNNLIKQNVDDNVITKAIETLTNREKVLKSKQLPFRFVTAYDNVEGNRRFTDAISEAMDIALENTPRLEGNTLIAIDGSGSMSGKPIKQASIFGATLMKANTNADVIIYDTSVQEVNLSSRIPTVDLAKTIERNAQGGGTMTSLVFQYAQLKNKIYDRIIIISDNESWVESYYGGSGIISAYSSYRKTVGADPFVYAIDIEGYGTKDIIGNKVKHLTGWSGRLLDFIGKHEEGGSLVEYISKIEI